MKFVVAALIGVISAGEVSEFKDLAPHSYIPSPYSLVQENEGTESESSESDDEDVQTQFDTIPVGYDGAHFYERKVTARFSQDTDDIFMRSMITAYAHEEKSKVEEHDDGTKSGGHFDVNRTGWIEVIKMPQFCRFLASDQWMS